MSVTGFIKRSKKAYFLMGTVSMLIPALLVIITLSVLYFKCSAQNQKLYTELGMQDKSTGYVLVQDIAAGTEIKADMLKKVSLTGEKNTAISSVTEKELIGGYAKSAFMKGSIINNQCIYKKEEYSQDMRIYEFDFIDISQTLQIGEFVDIRIAYPNGEDYIVVNHKQIIDICTENQELPETNQKIQMKVSEEEILRLASAYVDVRTYSESRIYAVSYLDQFQQSGIVNYPVNIQVFQLLDWNPNILDYIPSEEEQQHRTRLENNLQEYVKDSEVIINSALNQKEYSVDASAFLE